jgi:hypothetical protein
MRTILLAISILGTAVACSNKDPFAAGSDAPPGGDGKLGDSMTADAAPHHCVAAPARIIVLGDSITACSVIGGPQSADCISKKFSDYVIAHYGPGATYENHAVGGAKLADIAGQLAGVPAGTGRALVMIYIGGNDLSPFIFQSDSAAMDAYTMMIEPQLTSVYDATFASLADPAKFPAGATLLMNTQYNPFDDCTAPPYNLSATKTGILHMFNDKVTAIGAQHGDAAIVVDQHQPFLGHGHHYNVTTCPYYQAGDVAWMQDTIHANAAGNVDLANVADGGADRLYRDCIP